jgi:putative flippase GtrA
MKRIFYRLTQKRVARFILAGGSAFIVEYASFLILMSLGLPILIANTISFLAGLVTSFTLNKVFVFNNRDETVRQFTMYTSIALVNLGISDVLIWVSTHVWDLHYAVAKIVAVAFIALWNYGIFSRIIFINKGS